MANSEPGVTRTAPISVRLRPALNERVAALAAALDRPKSWIIEQALEDYLAVQAWQLAAIDEGIRAADAGQLIAHEDVAAWVRSWDGPEELPPPEHPSR